MSASAPAAAQPGFCRFPLGACHAIALHDGVVARDRPQGFVRNAEEAEVAEAFARIGLPAEKLSLTFTAMALEMPDRLVLFDTGNGASAPPTAGRLLSNLAAAGHGPQDVDVVLISHFHGDHISGLIDADGRPTYPNASVMVPQPEWDYWMSAEEREKAPEGLKKTFDLAERVFGALGNKVSRFAWGDEPVPGITAVQADGHTPGQTAFEITSEGERLMFVADITNNPLIFARNPEWQAAFDILPDVAVETRRRLLDRAAEEKLRLFFFHGPFPSNGYVAKSGDGYEFLPAMWGVEG